MRGYIDESYNESVFALSCLMAFGSELIWISWEWEKCIERWNARLKMQGRPVLSRYHAVYCSNLRKEFRDWSRDEQRELTSDLIGALRGHSIDTLAFAIDMKEFHSVFPEARKEVKPDVTGFIYGAMTKFLIYTLANEYCADHSECHISLIHDRCEYDGVMAEAFNNCFTTIEPRSWSNCTLLQPADLLAYENFKEAMRILDPRPRRRSLELLIDRNTLGGGVKFLNREALLALREWFRRKDEERGLAMDSKGREKKVRELALPAHNEHQ
jgi:hypothetical protein